MGYRARDFTGIGQNPSQWWREIKCFRDCIDNSMDEDNPDRALEAFVDAPILERIGFERMTPEYIGRPVYHPSTMLKPYIPSCSTIFSHHAD